MSKLITFQWWAVAIGMTIILVITLTSSLDTYAKAVPIALCAVLYLLLAWMIVMRKRGDY